MTHSHRAALQHMVDRARRLPSIAAIGAYGSTATASWTAHSDLDLILIMEHDAPVNSVHFFFQGIPVDLNLKVRTAWTSGDRGWLPPEDVSPLWDPEGLFAGVRSPSTPSSDAETYRYAHQHRLLKLAGWIDRDDEVADLIAAGATHWIAVSWFHARNMRFAGIDQAVAHWRLHQPELLELLITAARDRHGRLERMTKASELALAPVGGLWTESDIHFTGWHGSPTAGAIARAKAIIGQLCSPIDTSAADS